MNDSEERALKTQEDYQKEYDSLKKERDKAIKDHQTVYDEYIKAKENYADLKVKKDKTYSILDQLDSKMSKLSDEAKKKGFTLKRSFETTDTVELRALETEKDYQKEIDKWAEEVQDQLDRANTAKENWQYELDEAKADVASMEKIYKEGVKKGFKLKMKSFKIRSFDADDFEARKNDIVNNLTGFDERKANILLELRALKTQEDYQKEYDRLSKLLHTLAAEGRKIDEEIKKANDICKKKTEVCNQIIDKLLDIEDEAEAKGFKLKLERSFETTDIELRALKTQEDYQKEYDRLEAEYYKASNKVAEAEEEMKKAKDHYEYLSGMLKRYRATQRSRYDEMKEFKEKAKNKGFYLKA